MTSLSDVSRNYIDIMYLINPSNKKKIKRLKEEKPVIDMKEYRDDVVKIVNDILDGKKVTPELEYIFNEFYMKAKQHLLFKKKLQRVQSQYTKDVKKTNNVENTKVDILDISSLDITIMNNPIKKISHLNNFVKRTSKKISKKTILPTKINFE